MAVSILYWFETEGPRKGLVLRMCKDGSHDSRYEKPFRGPRGHGPKWSKYIFVGSVLEV